MADALLNASLRQQLSKSELVRRAVAVYLEQSESVAKVRTAPSVLALASDLVGCFGGGPKDLSSNPRHMNGLGQPSARRATSRAGIAVRTTKLPP